MTIVNHRLPELGYLLAPLMAVLWAAVADLIRREIPDSISVGLILWTVLAKSMGWLPFGWDAVILGFVVALILGSVGFWFKSFGGGDVKLLAALGASIGLSALWTMLFWTALAGGALALVAKWRGERELAFAPAIALGVIALVVSEGLA